MKPLANNPLEIPWDDHQFTTIPFFALLKMEYIQEGWKEDKHTELLEIKDKITAYYEVSMEGWELRKKITNPYEAIYSTSEDTLFPSLAKVVPLSRSFFKMVEMLEFSNILPEWKGKQIVSAHICEGPGGFIQAFIEKGKEYGIKIHQCNAMTLRPNKYHIPGWRRSAQFLKANQCVKLEYGADSTGNVLEPANQNYFIKKSSPVQFFTADGGFDFSVNYSKQEEDVFPLLLASFVIGLNCLEKNGLMIIKFFDWYSALTQDLILGSGACFKEFTVYKPATSRPCNAERYFIGKGYLGKGHTQKWISHLEKSQAIFPFTRLFQEEWPLPIKQLVKEQIQWQEKKQIQNIKETLNLPLSKDKLQEYILRNIETSKIWCKRFGVSTF